MAEDINKENDTSTATSPPTIWSQINLREVFSLRSTHYRGTQIFTALLIIGVFLGLTKFGRDALSSDVNSVLIEAKILKLVSSIFVSTQIIWSLFHVFIMIIFGSLIENIRGTYSLLTFIIQICLISEVLTLIIFLSAYYYNFNTDYLNKRICGFDAMFGAFCMCITEISPNGKVFANFCNFLTFQYLPLTLVVTINFLYFIGMIEESQNCLICIGTFIGWLILRFFAPNLSDGQKKGNDAKEFEFEFLFPPFLRFPIRQISNITFSFFKNVGCCETQKSQNKKVRNVNGINDNFNDLVLNLSGNKEENDGNESEEDTFTKSVIHKMNHSKDENDGDAKKRQEAKLLIERRLQQIQKEYNQRIISSANQ